MARAFSSHNMRPKGRIGVPAWIALGKAGVFVALVIEEARERIEPGRRHADMAPQAIVGDGLRESVAFGAISVARSNARAALCAIMGAAVAAAHGMDAIKHAAHLPFGGFKESEIAAFLRRVELTGLANELSRE
jgi:hypothetical protein